jgi:hypothetical protein
MSNYILALTRSLFKSILCRDLNPNPHHNDFPQLLHGSIITLIQDTLTLNYNYSAFLVMLVTSTLILTLTIGCCCNPHCRAFEPRAK